MINTLVGPSLKRYVDDKIKDRVKYIVNQKKLTVKEFPEFIQNFKSSSNISLEMEGQIILLRSLGKENGMKLRIQRDKLKEQTKA